LIIKSIENIEERSVSHNSKIKKHEFLAKGEIDGVMMFSRAVFPPGEIAAAHSHSNLTEVFYVESGTGEIIVDARTVQLKSGVCVAAEPGETHELRNTGSGDMIVLYFGIKT